jgi:hypothetical protein
MLTLDGLLCTGDLMCQLCIHNSVKCKVRVSRKNVNGLAEGEQILPSSSHFLCSHPLATFYY